LAITLTIAVPPAGILAEAGLTEKSTGETYCCTSSGKDLEGTITAVYFKNEKSISTSDELVFLKGILYF
jgi:hypothetical protein